MINETRFLEMFQEVTGEQERSAVCAFIIFEAVHGEDSIEADWQMLGLTPSPKALMNPGAVSIERKE